MGRSHRASETGLEKAKKAFDLKGRSQDFLAGRADCSREPVINFFARRPVAKPLFQAFCTALGLEWEEIAELEADEAPERSLSIDALIASVRDNIYGSIYEKCGVMHVLDMSQWISLDDIYTNVNILEKIIGRRRLGIPQLLEQAGLDNFERFGLSGICEKRVPGLEAVEQYSKLMVLGKPGAGKTTFLKHLAVQCVEGKFKPKLVPLFITLEDFAEASGQPSLLAYSGQLLASYGVELDTKVKTDILTTLSSGYSTDVELLLNQGRVLVLLDGLDEVMESDNRRVLKQIQHFTNQFHKNPFIITCRIAANEYTFEQFTEVEISDFDDQQIKTFATKWFRVKQDLVKVETFMEKIKKDKRIRELATSPILLTLLCIVFEGSNTFPVNRSELYKEGLDALLQKWDAQRIIQRDQVYRRLSLKRKEDLLSQIAMNTFEQGSYFFKQKEVEREITAYIRNLPGASIEEEEALQLNSEAVLKSIEAQHGLLIERARGIYSFSHLTFHEYFTARKLVTSTKSDIFRTRLLPHLTEKRWREVFLLTAGMAESADDLLLAMKQKIDELTAKDCRLQEFLNWIGKKASSAGVDYKPAAVRAFYFNHALNRTLELNRDSALELALNRDSALYRALKLALDSNSALELALYRYRELALCRALDRALNLDSALDPSLKQSLQVLKAQIPELSKKNRKQFNAWWEANGVTWIEQLRSAMIQYRDIGHDWQFTPEQKDLLSQYYDANRLLIDCLNSDCYVSREVRQEIESGLLLPMRKEAN